MRFFLLQVFPWIIFPQAPKNNIRVIQIFSKIHGDIRKWRCTTGINDTSGKFGTSINDTGSKFFHPNHRCCWYWQQICHQWQWHRWQIMGTISDCWHLKVNLKEKIYLYVNSIQGCESRRQTFSSITRPTFREIWKVSALPRSLTLLGKKVSPGSRPLFGFSRPNPAGNEIQIANR